MTTGPEGDAAEPVLRLLGDVRVGAAPVVGARSADLLAALAEHPAGLTDAQLLAEVWGEAAPAAKSVQVQVSRIRAQHGGRLVERTSGGYRLALPPDAVDVWRLEQAARDARTSPATDPGATLTAAATAEQLLAGLAAAAGDGPLARLRRRAAALAGPVRRSAALALARTGRDVEAVGRLAALHRDSPDDAEVLAALLRSEAATVGAAAALARWERYRAGLADRLGVDPDPELQRVHRELLAADDPVRTGVRFDADELLGRDDDLQQLRALVRSGRLTTVLGPGGLGKTRIAHLLAREATQPRVHVVELAGLSAGEDVVAEVGAALGVRDSVVGRRALTAAQHADVRGRIARELDQLPALLVLDNCEHLLDAVASLVAFLLATTRDLRIVTTSRAPLGIAAERVHPLSQLAGSDGVELFRRRALAVRPDAALPGPVVAAVVDRLDGLPLAVELAAARIRTLSVDQVLRGLDDRFTLLRGRDRSAPARHQTLTAVIDWSWDLLQPDERRALAALAVFPDGFSGDGAAAVLGAPGVPGSAEEPGTDQRTGHRSADELVQALVEQSLVTVTEQDGVVRHRMLETVREFAALRSTELGVAAAASAALDAWAVDLAERAGPLLFGRDQVAAVALLVTEEATLTEVLRRRLSDADAAGSIHLVATLGALWSVTGNFARFLALGDLIERVLRPWEPAPELRQVAVEGIAVVLLHLAFVRPDGLDELTALFARLPEPRRPWGRVARVMFAAGADQRARLAAVVDLARRTDRAAGPDARAVALVAWEWAALLAENEGAVDDAACHVARALELVDDDTTTSEVAALHVQAATRALNDGDLARAEGHARTAIPLLDALRATEDATSMRAVLAMSAVRAGRLADADRELARIGQVAPGDVTAVLTASAVRAELVLRRGDVAGGLAAFDACLETTRSWSFQAGWLYRLEPWTLIALSTDLAVHSRWATAPAELAHAAELYRETLDVLLRFPEIAETALDFPVLGMALFAAGQHLLLHGERALADPAVRLLAIARRCGYNRWFPALDWDEGVAAADAAAPGLLATVLDELGDRTGRELRPEVVQVLGTLTGTTGAGRGAVTSSA